MSYWTRVSAIFTTDSVDDVDEVFGKSCTWEEYIESVENDNLLANELDNHPERFMPCGSEGTLERNMMESDGLMNVHIHGSLRNFCDVRSVINWFWDCCERLRNYSAICSIESDLCGGTVITSGDKRYEQWSE